MFEKLFGLAPVRNIDPKKEVTETARRKPIM